METSLTTNFISDFQYQQGGYTCALLTMQINAAKQYNTGYNRYQYPT
ncbi:hypothetical protein [Niastella vici]|nr:hypothetical protein [Niastella vici]